MAYTTVINNMKVNNEALKKKKKIQESFFYRVVFMFLM